jgi:hypothetical protein
MIRSVFEAETGKNMKNRESRYSIKNEKSYIEIKTFLINILLSGILFSVFTNTAFSGELVYARVYGKVIDSMGQFVKNAEIIIGEKSRKEIFRNKGKYVTLKVGVKKSKTNSYGDFDIKNVVIGYQPVVVKVNNQEKIKDMIVINQGVNELNFTLPPADEVKSNIYKSSVTGKVFDERTRLPLSNVEIEINKTKILTNSEGDFHFKWIQPGYHFIYAFKSDYKDFVERINVRKKDNYFEIFMLPERKNVIISSKIIEEKTGRPVSEVMVEVNSKKVFTGENGTFQVMVEKNRHHVLTVSLPGYHEYSNYIFADKDKKLETIKLRLLRSERVYNNDTGVRPMQAEHQSERFFEAKDNIDNKLSEMDSLNKGENSGITYSKKFKYKKETRDAVNRKSIPSLKGGTGLLFLPDTNIQEKNRVRAAVRYTRFNSDNNLEEELYNTALTYGVTKDLEVGISNHQVEAHNKKINIIEDTETFFNLKYRGWKGKYGQTFAIGTDFSGDLFRAYATYGMNLGKYGEKGDLNFTLRKIIENNVSVTDYGLGCRLKLGHDFDFIIESVRESYYDSNMYNLGLRYSNEENISLDLYTSWLFDIDNARGIGGGVTWGF